MPIQCRPHRNRQTSPSPITCLASRCAAMPKLSRLSDPNPAALAEASRGHRRDATYADPFALLKDAPRRRGDHRDPQPLSPRPRRAAAESGRHVLCEKPLALSVAEAKEMLGAAERAGVRHMTAFTYRFVPAMQYMHHLVTSGAIGTPWHFRAQRFQDWGRRAIGWRQRLSEAGSGEIGDMLSHRLDFAHLTMGPMRACRGADESQIWPTRLDESRQRTPVGHRGLGGLPGASSSAASRGVFESVKTATGYAGGVTSRDFCEVNGSDGAVIYELSHPLRVLRAGKGAATSRGDVPTEFRKIRRLARATPTPTRGRVPIRSGLRVHRSHSRWSPVPALVRRRASRAGSDGGYRALGRRAAHG